MELRSELLPVLTSPVGPWIFILLGLISTFIAAGSVVWVWRPERKLTARGNVAAILLAIAGGLSLLGQLLTALSFQYVYTAGVLGLMFLGASIFMVKAYYIRRSQLTEEKTERYR